jgi:hypothetical protein
MKVQAVRTNESSPFAGIYDNIPRMPGEVFELLNSADGTMPLRMKRTYRKEKVFNPNTQRMESVYTDEYDEEIFLDSDGNPMHRDYAPWDEKQQGAGKAFGGEIFNLGWMRAVPDDTQCGLYPENEIIGERPAPVKRLSGATRTMNAPQSAPIKGTTERPVIKKAG